MVETALVLLLILFLNLRLKMKAAPTPNSGRGPGTEAAGPEADTISYSNVPFQTLGLYTRPGLYTLSMGLEAAPKVKVGSEFE